MSDGNSVQPLSLALSPVKAIIRKSDSILATSEVFILVCPSCHFFSVLLESEARALCILSNYSKPEFHYGKSYRFHPASSFSCIHFVIIPQLFSLSPILQYTIHAENTLSSSLIAWLLVVV